MLCGCPRFIPELLFRNAIAGFVGKIVSLLFVYRFDTLSVTSVYAVHLPKRAVPKGLHTFFINVFAELQRFVSDCRMF